MWISLLFVPVGIGVWLIFYYFLISLYYYLNNGLLQDLKKENASLFGFFGAAFWPVIYYNAKIEADLKKYFVDSRGVEIRIHRIAGALCWLVMALFVYLFSWNFYWKLLVDFFYFRGFWVFFGLYFAFAVHVFFIPVLLLLFAFRREG